MIRLSVNSGAASVLVASPTIMYETLKSAIPAITARQREVVELIAAGCSNEEIGEQLGISPRTAKAHSDILR